MEKPAFIPSSSVEGLTPDQVDNLRTSDVPLSIIPNGSNPILFTIDLSPNTDEDVDLGSITFPNAENFESIEIVLIDSQGNETPVTDQAGLQDPIPKADFPPETKAQKIRVTIVPTITSAAVKFNLDVRACFEETATAGTSPTAPGTSPTGPGTSPTVPGTSPTAPTSPTEKITSPTATQASTILSSTSTVSTTEKRTTQPSTTTTLAPPPSSTPFVSTTVACAEVNGMDNPAIIPASSITTVPATDVENLRPTSTDPATFPAGSTPDVTIDLTPVTNEEVELKSVQLVSPQNVESIRVFVIATDGSETEAAYLNPADLSLPIPKASFPAGTVAEKIRIEVTPTSSGQPTSFKIDVRACFEETAGLGTSPTVTIGTSPTVAIGTSPTLGSTTPRCVVTEGMGSPTVIPDTYLEQEPGFPSTDNPADLRPGDDPFTINPSDTPTNITLKITDGEPVDLSEVNLPVKENVDTFRVFGRTGPSAPWTLLTSTDDDPSDGILTFPPEVVVTDILVEIKPTDTTKPVDIDVSVHACFVVTTGTAGTSPTVVCAEVNGMDNPAIIPASSITTVPAATDVENLRPTSTDPATFPAGSTPDVTIDLTPVTNEEVELKSVQLVSPQNVESIRVFVIATDGSETEAAYLNPADLSLPIPKASFPAGTVAEKIRIEVTPTSSGQPTSFKIDVRACFEETAGLGTSPTVTIGTSPTVAIGTSPTLGSTTPRCVVTEGMGSPTVIPDTYLEQEPAFPSTDNPADLRPGDDPFTINPSDTATNVTLKITDGEPVDLSEVNLPVRENVKTFRVFGRTGPSAPWTLLESTDDDPSDGILTFPPEVVVTDILVEITPTNITEPINIDVSVHACFVVTTGTAGTSPTVVCAEVNGMDNPAIIPASSITTVPAADVENLRPASTDPATFPAGSTPNVTIDLTPVTNEEVELKSVQLVSPDNVQSIRVFVTPTGGSETEATYLNPADLSLPSLKASFPAGTVAENIRIEVTPTSVDQPTVFKIDVRACFEETAGTAGTSPTGPPAVTSPTLPATQGTPSSPTGCVREFGPWEEWGPCTPCMNGTRSRTRNCATCCGDNSTPDVETEACNSCQCSLNEADIIAELTFLPANNELGYLVNDQGQVVKNNETLVRFGNGQMLASGVTVVGQCLNCTCEMDGTLKCTVMDCECPEWAPWSDCSKNCGGGERTRTRNAQPAGSSSNCSAPEVEPCNEQPCSTPTPECWSTWSEFSNCPTSACLQTTQTRSRTCSNNTAGCVCSEALQSESRDCAVSCPSTPICETNQFYNSNCSLPSVQSCRDMRLGSTPQEVYNNETCLPACRCEENRFTYNQMCLEREECPCFDSDGNEYPVGFSTNNTQTCEECKCDMLNGYVCTPIQDCCVYGEWSVWSDCVSNCSVGTEGVRSRSRTSNSPTCPKPTDVETEPCQSPCPCVLENGTELPNGQSVSENCTKCECKNGTLDCGPDAVQDVDGQWSTWTQWSNCSKDCRNYNKTRYRICGSPEAECNGATCVGDAQETELCGPDPCCDFIFGDYTPCSQNCSSNGTVGTRSRPKILVNQNEANVCLSIDPVVEQCNNEPCLCVNGTEWGPWSQCSLNGKTVPEECGWGTHTRTRTVRAECVQSTPASETEPCFLQDCNCTEPNEKPSNFTACEYTCGMDTPPDNCETGTPEFTCICADGYRRLDGSCVEPVECEKCVFNGVTYGVNETWKDADGCTSHQCLDGKIIDYPKACDDISTCNLTTHSLVPDPCCGTVCKPKTCSMAVFSGEVSFENCVSTQNITYNYCEGECGPSSFIPDFASGNMTKNCKCCTGTYTGSKTYTFNCGGTNRDVQIPEISSCGCDKCNDTGRSTLDILDQAQVTPYT
uniref:Pedal mucus protein 6 n=1 Tax=Patella vulgata TaxID=6465 RepID=A0A7D5H9V0_PATVU|nr:pedal mucus protein 6 [Patella vulgata]